MLTDIFHYKFLPTFPALPSLLLRGWDISGTYWGCSVSKEIELVKPHTLVGLWAGWGQWG